MGNITNVTSLCYNHDCDNGETNIAITARQPKVCSLTSIRLKQNHECDNNDVEEEIQNNPCDGYDNYESDTLNEVSPITSLSHSSVAHSVSFRNITCDDNSLTDECSRAANIEAQSIMLQSSELTYTTTLLKQPNTRTTPPLALPSVTSTHSVITTVVHIDNDIKNYKEMKGEVLFNMMQSPSIARM